MLGRNENGWKVIELCTGKKLYVRNTFLDKMAIHKLTWGNRDDDCKKPVGNHCSSGGGHE